MPTREPDIVRQAQARQQFLLDMHSAGVMKALKEVYPALHDKLFEGNKFMEILVMYGKSPMEILDFPVCGRCETLALPDGRKKKDGEIVPVCTCVKEGCGITTVNPPTLKEWLADELKKRAPSDFVDALELAIDEVAYTMFMKFLKDVAEAKRKHKQQPTLLRPEDNKPVINHLGVIAPDLTGLNVEFEAE